MPIKEDTWGSGCIFCCEQSVVFKTIPRRAPRELRSTDVGVGIEIKEGKK